MFAIRNADIEDVTRIAIIHKETIPNSINSLMGLQRLMGLYMALIEDESSQLLVAVSSNDVIGFISGTSEFGKVLKGAKNSITTHQIIRLLRNMNLAKIVLAIVDWLLINRQLKKMKNFYYFSKWGMLPNSPLGAATAIFKELIKHAKNHGSDSIVVNLPKNNGRLVNMYEKLGFVEIQRTISEVVLVKKI